MKQTVILICLFLLLFFTSCHDSDTDPSTGPLSKDQRMEWWREARFGMFIHWGVYSVYGNVYQGPNVKGELVNYNEANSGYPSEWIMNLAQIPRSEYRKAAQEFDASDYNPSEWVQIAKNAGMKYIVITTKHHDGFSLFDSKVTDWDAVDASAARRDLLKDLVKEAKNAGLKVGFYYSQNQDWMHEGGMGYIPELNGQTYSDEEVLKYVDNIVIPHIEELTENYDFDLFWFDSPWANKNAELALKILNALEKSKVGNKVITNDRLMDGLDGDYKTPETDTPYIPYNGYENNTDWEACASLNNSWGYENTPADSWKTPVYTISRILELTSKGGNFLLNVGPDKHGKIPDGAVNTLAKVGEWMKKNGTSIYGTVKNELLNPFEYGYVTQKINKDGSEDLFLHVSSTFADEPVIYLDGVVDRPSKAFILATNENVDIEQTSKGLTIQQSANSKDPYFTTIQLHFSKKPAQTNVSTLRQNGIIRLTPYQGVTSGIKKNFSPYAFSEWFQSSDFIRFNIYLDAGKYTAETEYSAWNNGEMYFTFNNQSYTIPYNKTTGMDSYVSQKHEGVIIDIPSSGKYELNVKRATGATFNIINLRKIILKKS